MLSWKGSGAPQELKARLKALRALKARLKSSKRGSRAHEDVACGTHLARLKPLKPHRAVLHELTTHISSCSISTVRGSGPSSLTGRCSKSSERTREGTREDSDFGCFQVISYHCLLLLSFSCVFCVLRKKTSSPFLTGRGSIILRTPHRSTKGPMMRTTSRPPSWMISSLI